MKQPKLTIVDVSLTDITPNPWNPHGTTPEELSELVESIATKGVIDTPTVVEWDRPLQYEERSIEPVTRYLLVDGEQRFTAAREAFTRGLRELPIIPVTLLGSASSFSDAELAELGEALNHRGRGSLEDIKKTGVIASWLSQRKGPAEAARLMGKSQAFVEKALAAVQPKAQPNLAPRAQQHQQRKALNIVLPFEDEADVDEFETLLGRVQLQASPASRGQRRSAQVLTALRFYAEQQ